MLTALLIMIVLGCIFLPMWHKEDNYQNDDPDVFLG